MGGTVVDLGDASVPVSSSSSSENGLRRAFSVVESCDTVREGARRAEGRGGMAGLGAMKEGGSG